MSGPPDQVNTVVNALVSSFQPRTLEIVSVTDATLPDPPNQTSPGRVAILRYTGL